MDEALQESKYILGTDEEVPEFFDELEESFIEIPDHPSEDQLELDIEIEQLVPISEKEKPKIPKKPRPRRPPIDLYRVVVWRESRKDEISVSVSKI